MRLGQIVITDLAKEKLVLEERLEKTVNSDMDIEVKLSIIKATLKEIVLGESMFVKWQNYMTPQDNTAAKTAEENNG